MEALLALSLFSFFGGFSNSAQQMIGFGKCPDREGMIADFDITKYAGTWYEQYRYFITPEIGTICTHVNITQSEEGGLTYQVLFLDPWNDDYEMVNGYAKIEGPEGRGKFTIDFVNRGNFSITYRIIDTDYESYSVVWSCENKRGYNIRNIWIFTREEYPPDETIDKAAIVLKKNKMPTKFFIKIDQTNCSKIDIEINPDAEYIDDIEPNTDAEEI